MNQVNTNGETQQSIEQHEGIIPRRGRGRPKGSKNRKYATTSAAASRRGWEGDIKLSGRPKSLATHRKWQRDWVMPQFVLTRRQAQEMLLKYLRSKPGKSALTAVIQEGFVGLSKMPDNKLAEFLISTNLLSRYPHEIVIRGL